MKNLLLVEPGIRAYKEHIVEKLAKVSGVRLFYATGLHDLFDYHWMEKYASDPIRFSYSRGDLLDSVLRFQASHQLTFDGVVTYVEPSLLATNEVAHALKLPPISGFRDRAIRNKGLARERMHSKGLVQPWFRVLKSEVELEEMISQGVLFPMVVKPTEMMSSLGVIRVETPEELRKAFLKGRDADFWDENLREVYTDMHREVLCEEYIEGNEISVETAVHRGVPKIIGITQKETTEDGFFDELGHCFPAQSLSSIQRTRIEAVVVAAHRALDLLNGVTHTEIRIRNDVPYIVEVNCRLGGDMISVLMEKSSGIDVGSLLANLACGEPFEFVPPISPRPHRIRFAATSHEGRVIQEPILSSPSPTEIHCEAKIGDILHRNGLVGKSRIGFAISDDSAMRVSIQNESSFVQPLLAVAPLRTNDSLLVFEALQSDIPELCAIEKASWEPELAAPSSLIEERFRVNPSAFFVGVSLKSKKIEGFVTVVPLSSTIDDQGWAAYAQMSVDPDYLRKNFSNHLPPPVMHILTITIHHNAPLGTGTALVREVANHFKTKGVLMLRYGIRLPQLARLCEQGVQPDEYFKGLIEGKYREPLFGLAMKAGAIPTRLFKSYYEDPASRNFAILMEHRLNNG